MPKYKHNDYYGYINSISTKAIQNPEWFWSDAEDATQARQWLYNNGAKGVVDDIYNNTPSEIQSKIDKKKLSHTTQAQQTAKNVSEGIDKAGQQFAPVLATTFAAPYAIGLGTKALLNPYVRTALDVAGNIDGTRNFFTDNGVSKTFRLAKEGDTWGAIKSGTIDVLDLLGTADLLRMFNKGADALRTFNTASRYSNSNPRVFNRNSNSRVLEAPPTLKVLDSHQNPELLEAHQSPKLLTGHYYPAKVSVQLPHRVKDGSLQDWPVSIVKSGHILPIRKRNSKTGGWFNTKTFVPNVITPLYDLDPFNPNTTDLLGYTSQSADVIGVKHPGDERRLQGIFETNARIFRKLLGDEKIVKYPDEFKEALYHKSLIDAEKAGLDIYSQSLLDPRRKRLERNFKDNWYKLRNAEIVDEFAEKRKRLANYRKAAKYVKNFTQQNSKSIDIQLPQVLEDIIKNEHLEAYRPRIQNWYNQTNSVEETVKNLIQNKYSVVRGVNMSPDDQTSAISALTEMYDLRGKGGRADIPYGVLSSRYLNDKMGVLYTSNSFPTASAYAYTSQPGDKAIGTLGLPTIDTSGDVTTWIKNNRPNIKRLPNNSRDINVNEFYYLVAPSTEHNRHVESVFPNENIKNIFKNLLHRSKNVRNAFNARPDLIKHRETPGLRHILFFGPKGKSIEDAGLKLQNVIQNKNIPYFQGQTRMHHGDWSEGLTHEFKQGGIITKKDTNHNEN